MVTFQCCDCRRNNAHLSRKRSVFERVLLVLFCSGRCVVKTASGVSV
jgi:hypothetical protein